MARNSTINSQSFGACGPWLYQSVSVCVCVCVCVCVYEELSLALPDESPVGKHNYLPQCLPIISAEEVLVSQLKR